MILFVILLIDLDIMLPMVAMIDLDIVSGIPPISRLNWCIHFPTSALNCIVIRLKVMLVTLCLRSKYGPMISLNMGHWRLWGTFYACILKCGLMVSLKYRWYNSLGNWKLCWSFFLCFELRAINLYYECMWLLGWTFQGNVETYTLIFPAFWIKGCQFIFWMHAVTGLNILG